MIIVCVSKFFLLLFFSLLIMVDDWVYYSINWRARESFDRLEVKLCGELRRKQTGCFVSAKFLLSFRVLSFCRKQSKFPRLFLENLKNRAIFLRLTYLLAGTCWLNMAISEEKKFLEIWRLWRFFFNRSPLYESFLGGKFSLLKKKKEKNTHAQRWNKKSSCAGAWIVSKIGWSILKETYWVLENSTTDHWATMSNKTLGYFAWIAFLKDLRLRVCVQLLVLLEERERKREKVTLCVRGEPFLHSSFTFLENWQ